MDLKKPIHNFHIPVMGLAYTIDSPIRVAQYGISSVISIIDDEIIEKMNSLYHKRNNFSYKEISNKVEDYRAKRITAYLDMVQEVVNERFDTFKQELSKSKESLQQYIAMLPNKSDFKKGLENLAEQKENFTENVWKFLESHLSPGSIDVNVMTKVDKDNFVKGEQLPVIYNDAHVSLRGFANSKLSSSIVLSAGMNPRLYSYFETFPDFFPNEKGVLKKKIILKVSDFRSAMIQGNFLAKKGLWVSEYRVESGLNCGGHAFATDGLLLGPIMEEFKQKKNELIASAHELMNNALTLKGLCYPTHPMDMKITVQGGVGTAEEHEFLLENYQVDSIGWGSPFLLVPEATSVDPETRKLLSKSKEEDYYLSNISPLGIPFNTIKGTTNEFLKKDKISKDKAGSSCPKKYLALSKEFGPEGICTASRKYQQVKLADLEVSKAEINIHEYEKRKNKITEKSCLCVGLVNSSYLENEIPIKGEKQGVVVCPGPNLAYFDKEVSLSDMLKHIYGSINIIPDTKRPNVFINELKLYVNFLKNEIEEYTNILNNAQVKKWKTFKNNLIDGVTYYENLFAATNFFKNNYAVIEQQLADYKRQIMNLEIPEVKMV
ncbi:hypothetical protein FNJ88_02875 [Chryseobacterium sp. SNU WT5]|uniref:hypothetical protein n=1 Tax=Chryseobacterium sp. SNU WT5 TaxID=2594269 RepID=UPI00117DCD8B|nr:hypothetical protein [Chryseobacterium sp. SNU WT5]QDP84550.1 hypothetical protein FNJ88_02875 [Chryseobacterium sp. SNU WT5]